jgi:hypothetical protein
VNEHDNSLVLIAAGWFDVLKEMGITDHELVVRRMTDSDPAVLRHTCIDWVEQVEEKVRDVRDKWRLFPPKRWAMMKMLKIKLPEFDKLKESVNDLERLWNKGRPGILRGSK